MRTARTSLWEPKQSKQMHAACRRCLADRFGHPSVPDLFSPHFSHALTSYYFIIIASSHEGRLLQQDMNKAHTSQCS